MSATSSELLVDVRPMPPRNRHATIFNTWQRMEDGQSMLLVNDHDPLPLYFQFSCEHQGEFNWEYVESGPEVWQVRISKGRYEHPGFVPQRKPAASKCSTSTPISFVEPMVVDTRPIFGRGETPCGVIDEAVENVIPGQALVLLVPFEPKPLYGKLGAQGFSHKASLEPDGTWRIEFKRS